MIFSVARGRQVVFFCPRLFLFSEFTFFLCIVFGFCFAIPHRHTQKTKEPLFTTVRCRHRVEGHPLRVSHKEDWGRRFILYYPIMLYCCESDAGSDGVESASGFVIHNRQTSCSVWARYLDVVYGLFRAAALAIR